MNIINEIVFSHDIPFYWTLVMILNNVTQNDFRKTHFGNFFRKIKRYENNRRKTSDFVCSINICSTYRNQLEEYKIWVECKIMIVILLSKVETRKQSSCFWLIFQQVKQKKNRSFSISSVKQQRALVIMFIHLLIKYTKSTSA